jgi:hypothetical protein
LQNRVHQPTWPKDRAENWTFRYNFLKSP